MVRRIWRNTKWREKNSHVHVKPYQWAYPSGFSVIYRVFVRNDNMICMLRKERMIDESGMLRFDINRARCEQHHCCMVYGRMIAKPWQRQQQQQQPATGTMSMWGRSPSLLCACKNTMFFFLLRFCCCCCCVLWLDFLFNALPQCYWVCRWKRNCAYRWANRKQATKMGLFVAWTSLALMGPPVKEKKTPFDLFPFPATITYLYVCSMFIHYMYILSVIYLQAMRSSQQKCSCQLRVRARTNTRSVSSHPTPKQRILYLPRNSFSTRTIRHWGQICMRHLYMYTIGLSIHSFQWSAQTAQNTQIHTHSRKRYLLLKCGSLMART